MFVTLLGDGLDPGSGETQALRWAEWPTGQFDGGAHPYGDPSDYGASGPGDPMTLAIVEDGEQDPGSQETAGIYLELNPYYPNFTVIDRDHIVRGNGLLATAAFELADELLDEDRPEVEWPLPENADELRELLGL